MAEEIRRMREKYDTTANWTANNPTLAASELGVEKPVSGPWKLKIGDGVTAWNGLLYHVGMADTGTLSCTKNGDQAGINTSGETITNWSELWDRDSEFNETTGVFTASSERKISTNITLQFNSASAYGIIEVYKDAAIMGYTISPSGIVWPAASLHVDFEVEVGDTVYWLVKASSGTIDVVGDPAIRTQVSIRDLS